MRTVKSYSNLAEAGFASSLLEAAGIRTLLADEQSSLWSYGMAIPIRLQVDDADFEKAHEILKNGLSGADTTDEPVATELRPSPGEPGKIPVGLFVAAAILFALLVFVVRNIGSRERRGKVSSSSHDETYEYDQNHDGRPDCFYEYFGDLLKRSRTDRNFDGKVDEWVFFDSEGRPERSEQDDNFDGQPDGWFIYRHGRLESGKVDSDFNGRWDWITAYENGLPVRSDARPNESDIVSRRLLYESGMLVEERVDDDRDGKFDYKIVHDPYGAMSERIPLEQPK